MKKDFIPTRNADLNSFEENFLEKLERHSAALNMKSSDTESVISAIEANRKAFTKMNLIRANYKSACDSYRATRKKAVSEIRRFSQRMKGSLNYDRSHGADFGIIYPQNEFDSTPDLKPTLKVKVNAERIIIKFKKQGADGIKIYSKIAGGKNFEFLAHAVRHTYTDKRGKSDDSKPEAREYYGIYFKEDKEVGKESDVVRVVIP